LSESFEKYRRLQDKLIWIRWQHLGHESDEEDALLEEMDGVWWSLTGDERAVVSADQRGASPIKDRPKGARLVDVDVSRHPGAVRRCSG